MHFRRWTAVTLALISSAVAAPSGRAATLGDTNADNSINVGSASLFTVLARGDLSSYDDNITGPSMVTGNVGIGGKANFAMSDGVINGDFYMNDYGTFSKSGPATINGTLRGKNFNNGTGSQQLILNSAVGDVSDMTTSSGGPGLAYWAAQENRTYNYTFGGTQATPSNYLSTVNTGKSMTVADSNPFGGSKIVLNLQDFVMTSGKFTLQGSAMTTYIINVSRNFSLNNSSVVLSGGLLASHVLFNVMGSGSQVSLNQGTSLHGIMLAYNRKLDLSGGKIYGRAIANQVVITSGGQVNSE